MLPAAGNHVSVLFALPWQHGVHSVVFVLAFDTKREDFQKEKENPSENEGCFRRPGEEWMQIEPTNL